MNYPTTVTNPLLKKHQQVPDKRNEKSSLFGDPSTTSPVKFSNYDRPTSCPTVPLQRPFSSHFQSGLKFQATRVLSKAGAEKISSATIETQLQAKQREEQLRLQQAKSNIEGENAGDLDISASQVDNKKPSMMDVREGEDEEGSKESEEEEKEVDPFKSFKAVTSGISQASLVFGKTIHNSNYASVKQTTIKSLTDHVDAMPMPRKFQLAKKKAEREEKKKKAAEEKAEREALEA